VTQMWCDLGIRLWPDSDTYGGLTYSHMVA